MGPKVELITENIFGEGPHWDAETQSLYFLDFEEHTINKYVPSTKRHTKVNMGKNVSFIIPVKGKKDQFIISYGKEIAIITWNGESDKVTFDQKLYEVDKGKDSNVFNDGKCDPSGRLWTGTMGSSIKSMPIPDGEGSFYSFKDKKTTMYFDKVGISNGIAFNSKLKKMYYIDSYRRSVDQFDFDMENGTIANRTPVFTAKNISKDEIFDGMTIDTDGNLFVALFGGSRVIKIDPRKTDTLLENISIPAPMVTSVTFGGPNLDELFVTTGGKDINGKELSRPANGATYRVTGINSKGFDGDQAVL